VMQLLAEEEISKDRPSVYIIALTKQTGGVTRIYQEVLLSRDHQNG